jgi:hypothetical protein
MKRPRARGDIALLALAMVTLALGLFAALLAAETPSSGKTYRIGYLLELAPPQASFPLEESLRDLGYVDGRNLVSERRFAALSTAPVRALQQATAMIPIVFLLGDPLGVGLMRSRFLAGRIDLDRVSLQR